MTFRWLFIGDSEYRPIPAQSASAADGVEWLDTLPTAENLASNDLVIDFLPENECKKDMLMSIAQCTAWHGTVASMIEIHSAAHRALESGLQRRFVGFCMPAVVGQRSARYGLETICGGGADRVFAQSLKGNRLKKSWVKNHPEMNYITLKRRT